MKFLIAGLATIVAAHGIALADPLAPAHNGKVQCYQPDQARKVCRSIGSYVFDAKGNILNRAESLVSPQQFIVMTTASAVVVRGENECGVLRKEDVEASEIDMNGQKMPEEQAAQVRTQIEAAMTPMMGKEICSSYATQPDGTMLSSETIDGTPMSDHQIVLWVDPSDGYKVAP